MYPAKKKRGGGNNRWIYVIIAFWKKTDHKSLLEVFVFGRKDWGLGGRDTDFLFCTVNFYFGHACHLIFLKHRRNRCSRSAPRYEYLESLGRGLSSCILFKALSDFDAKADFGLTGKKKGIFALCRCECTCDCVWEGWGLEQDSTFKKKKNSPLQYSLHRSSLSLLPRRQIRQWAQSPLPKARPEWSLFPMGRWVVKGDKCRL